MKRDNESSTGGYRYMIVGKNGYYWYSVWTPDGVLLDKIGGRETRSWRSDTYLSASRPGAKRAVKRLVRRHKKHGFNDAVVVDEGVIE